MITRRNFIKGVAAGTIAAVTHTGSFGASAQEKPNIIFILSDDIGYGDLGCYGAAKVKTANLDRLAREGIRLTDAHSTSAVCTPTRYSILTGQYAWRCPEGNGILSGMASLSIDPAMPTTPSMLKKAGYATGLVGKWHLGLGTKEKPVDYNAEITPGPLDVGFDSAFFYPATNDRVPCVYAQDRHVIGLDPKDPIQVSYEHKIGDGPTGEESPDLLKMKADRQHSQTIVNGISRIGYMTGGNAARWVDEDMADTLTGKAVAFIEQNKNRPFFLYFTPHDIHEPMAPHPRFRGTSECGTRGDAIHELDWSVGEIMAALDRLGLAENTLLIFTSDNGGAIKDTYDDGTNAQHAKQPPNGVLRGAKGSLYEGGHRVPLLARWPAHIPAGAVSNALVGLVDMMATFASAAGEPLEESAGPDSFNALLSLLQDSGAPSTRKYLVLHAGGNGPLGLRMDNWMLITKNRDNTKPPELYDLTADLAETSDLAAKKPAITKELGEKLAEIRKNQRTRP